jgi:hypothetical protein
MNLIEAQKAVDEIELQVGGMSGPTDTVLALAKAIAALRTALK